MDIIGATFIWVGIFLCRARAEAGDTVERIGSRATISDNESNILAVQAWECVRCLLVRIAPAVRRSIPSCRDRQGYLDLS
jgi:hypothetical protein